MKHLQKFLLPAGISAALPPEVSKIEQLRRHLLDLYATWGYEQVIPPFLEYTDALLIETWHDLDLKTYRVVDQLTGKWMGIRADMTPQVARIDALELGGQTPARLCYIGTVLHTRPDGFARSRCPIQIGLELYGSQAIDSDFEVLALLLATLQTAQITDFHVDVGHVGICQSLIAQVVNLAFPDTATDMMARQTFSDDLFSAIQSKACAEITALMQPHAIPTELHTNLLTLIELNGDATVLTTARQRLNHLPEPALQALDELDALVNLHQAYQAITEIPPLYFDLAEISGYRYYTGLVFAAYVEGHGEALAQGGRYDNLSQAFGKNRPATGFSADLRTLIALNAQDTVIPVNKIFAPAIQDAALAKTIHTLRQAGKTVVQGVPDQVADPVTMGCAQALRLVDGEWQLTDLNS